MRCNIAHIAGTLISMLLLSCNLFETRESEIPDTGQQPLPQATDDQILLQNFTLAIQQKNVTEYTKLFADTVTHKQQFLFVPNQSAAARYNAVFSTWNKSAEVEYFRNAMGAVNAASTPELLLTYPTPKTQYQSDSIIYTVDYTLYLPHTRGTGLTMFAGQSKLHMAPDKNNIWMIYRWEDFETRKDSSWSELKGQFAK